MSESYVTQQDMIATEMYERLYQGNSVREVCDTLVAHQVHGGSMPYCIENSSQCHYWFHSICSLLIRTHEVHQSVQKSKY
jgi:hypothetical protein